MTVFSPIRIAHLADLHLGYRYTPHLIDGVNVRAKDGYQALDEIVTQIIDHAIPIVLIMCSHTPSAISCRT